MKKSEGGTIKVKLCKSAAARTKRLKAVLHALGLKKIGDVREYPANAAVLGTIRRVEHLVEIIK